MYDCPNCGGNLRFDISLQQLHCDFCGTNMDPYSYEKKKDAVESQVFETTVYTCPQCGGEIMTTNVSATGFCMYCGASTILDSRIRNEKRPARIIPFQKTKEDCKKSFAGMMRRSLYAPKELKSPEYLEKFRGIYIPYWLYDFKINRIQGMHGSNTSRHGDYIVTKHYSLSCDMDTVYSGVSFDASSALDDSLSESIAPFDPNTAKDFTPSFLCGFYADTADVPADTYSGDALGLIAEDVVDQAKSRIFPGNGAEMPADPEHVLQYSGTEPVCAMFPVWFLTYRHRDRVAYAIMNGQTGKISSDLPIVEGKYLAGSIVLAVPLFFLFNAVLTVTASTALLLTMIPAAAAGFAYLSEIRAQISMESHEGDKGYHAAVRLAPDASVQKTGMEAVQVQEAGTIQETGADPVPEQAAGFNPVTAQTADIDPVPAQTAGIDPVPGRAADPEASQAGGMNASQAQTAKSKRAADRKADRKAEKKRKKSLQKLKNSSVSIMTLILIYIVYAIMGSVESLTDVLHLVLTIIPVGLGIWLAVSGISLHREHGAKKAGVFPGITGAVLALAISELVTIFHPVSDLYYYGAGIVSILCTGFTLTAVVRRYNLMATRPLPSFFDRKGGDVRG